MFLISKMQTYNEVYTLHNFGQIHSVNYRMPIIKMDYVKYITIVAYSDWLFRLNIFIQIKLE